VKLPPAGPTPVGDRLRAQTIPAKRHDGPDVDEWADDWLEMPDDDEPLACGLENPDYCESCQ